MGRPSFHEEKEGWQWEEKEEDTGHYDGHYGEEGDIGVVLESAEGEGV